MSADRVEPQPLDLSDASLLNDSGWLRDIAEGADILPDNGDLQGTCTIASANQWLWPETRDNLIEISAKLAALAEQRKALLEAVKKREFEEYGYPDTTMPVLISSHDIRAILGVKP